MLKIIIIGARGQLGREFCECIKSGKTDLGKLEDEIINAQVDSFGVESLDILDRKNLDSIMSAGYDYCINCSAYTAVDKAEDDSVNCYRVNTLGVQNLAYACQKYGTILVHFSTDYVYSGTRNVPLNETDATCPVTVYGKTKLAGENYIREICDRYYIIRTSWLYGEWGNNFVYKMLELAQKMDKLTVVNDQIGTPTSANDLVYTTLKLMRSGNFGVYNCSGEGQCSWYDFACEILRLGGIATPILPVDSATFSSKAERPKYSVLDNLALRSIGLNFMRPWETALKSFLTKVR